VHLLTGSKEIHISQNQQTREMQNPNLKELNVKKHKYISLYYPISLLLTFSELIKHINMHELL